MLITTNYNIFSSSSLTNNCIIIHAYTIGYKQQNVPIDEIVVEQTNKQTHIRKGIDHRHRQTHIYAYIYIYIHTRIQYNFYTIVPQHTKVSIFEQTNLNEAAKFIITSSLYNIKSNMDTNSNSDNINSNNANNNNNSSATSNDNNGGYQQSSANENNDGWGGRNNHNASSSNDNYSRNNNNRRWNGDRARPPQDVAGKELYCGNLPGDVTDDELHDLFRKYGNIERIKVLGRRSDSKFAFVVFRRAEDALEAARGRDGIQFADRSIKVEISKSRERNRGGRGNDDRFDRGGDRRFRDDRRRDDRGSYRDDRRRNDRGSYREDRRGRDDRRRDDRGGRGNDRGGDRRKCFHTIHVYPQYYIPIAHTNLKFVFHNRI